MKESKRPLGVVEITTAERSYHAWDWRNKGKKLELLKFRRLEKRPCEAEIQTSEGQRCWAGASVPKCLIRMVLQVLDKLQVHVLPGEGTVALGWSSVTGVMLTRARSRKVTYKKVMCSDSDRMKEDATSLFCLVSIIGWAWQNQWVKEKCGL